MPLIKTPSRRANFSIMAPGTNGIGALALIIILGVTEKAVTVGMKFQHAAGWLERQSFAVFNRLGIGRRRIVSLLMVMGPMFPIGSRTPPPRTNSRTASTARPSLLLLSHTPPKTRTRKKSVCTVRPSPRTREADLARVPLADQRSASLSTAAFAAHCGPPPRSAGFGPPTGIPPADAHPR